MCQTLPGAGDAVCSGGDRAIKYTNEGGITPGGRCLTYRGCFLFGGLLKANCVAARLANSSSRALFEPRFDTRQRSSEKTDSNKTHSIRVGVQHQEVKTT